MSISSKKVIVIKAKPILRWAGGKKWLSPFIHELVRNNTYRNYHEPFLGGGAIFLSLQPSMAYLSDLNKELINTYKTVRDNPIGVINKLKEFKNTENFYYKIRSLRPDSNIAKAASFIYLNQTSFNGIYRVNLNGEYNVPYGFRKKNFLDEENIKQMSRLLKKASLINCDFECIKPNIKKKDLIFLDPPYTVSHNLNGFIKYNQKLFSLSDQYRLSDLVDYIKRKDAYYIVSNAAHETIKQIFDKKDSIVKLRRGSLIGGLNAKRGVVDEYLFTNLQIT